MRTLEEKACAFSIITAEQNELAELAHSLLNGDLTKEEAVKKILLHVQEMGESLTVILNDDEGETEESADRG